MLYLFFQKKAGKNRYFLVKNGWVIAIFIIQYP